PLQRSPLALIRVALRISVRFEEARAAVPKFGEHVRRRAWPKDRATRVNASEFRCRARVEARRSLADERPRIAVVCGQNPRGFGHAQIVANKERSQCSARWRSPPRPRSARRRSGEPLQYPSPEERDSRNAWRPIRGVTRGRGAHASASMRVRAGASRLHAPAAPARARPRSPPGGWAASRAPRRSGIRRPRTEA
ncbi:MAG: hypothetical protein RL385_416, partial [Pseudomonadota bacterium]